MSPFTQQSSCTLKTQFINVCTQIETNLQFPDHVGEAVHRSGRLTGVHDSYSQNIIVTKCLQQQAETTLHKTSVKCLRPFTPYEQNNSLLSGSLLQ